MPEHRTPCPSGRHHAHRMQTCEQYEKWRREISRAIEVPRLPLVVRVRLSVEQGIDTLASWLCAHRASGAAEWLWRICRML